VGFEEVDREDERFLAVAFDEIDRPPSHERRLRVFLEEGGGTLT